MPDKHRTPIARRELVAAVMVVVLSVLIGWQTLPTIPKLNKYQEIDPRNSNYAVGGSACDPAVLVSIRSKSERLRRTDACAKEAEEYRQNTADLIQQTRAADAAHAQADIASQQLKAGWIQTIGNFLTLTAAIAAAYFARQAARFTREANEITEDVSKKQLRPYLYFESGKFEISLEDNFVNANVVIELKNGGQSPAIITRLAHVIFVQDSGGTAGGVNGMPQIVGIGSPYVVQGGVGSRLERIDTRCVVHVGLRYEYTSEHGSWTEDVWLYGKADYPDGGGEFKQGSLPNHPSSRSLESIFSDL